MSSATEPSESSLSTTTARPEDAPPPEALFGVLAEFETASAVFHACEGVRDAGFTRWDAHTPFPVHGLDRAMGLRPTVLPWIVLAMGITGASSGLLMQWWMNAIDYPLVISGKPLFSWQAFVPVMFELMVLFSALGCLFGMLGLNRLPRPHHPLFSSTRFERATDDRFFISIEASDPRFDAAATVALLHGLGAKSVERVVD
jgi:hypothetical protein